MKGVSNRLIIFILILFSCSVRAGTLDSIPSVKVVSSENRDWWYLFKKGELDLKDTTVIYPKFLKFCVNVYNWGDRTFNSYNPEYVEGTGYRWKARIVNDNWTDSYSMRFRHRDFNIRMIDNLNVNLGAYLQYMAVSVGYSHDMNSLFGGEKNKHSRFETNFNCALFNFDLHYTRNSGGTYIRHITGYKDNKLIHSYFPGLKMTDFGVSLYYFLNNKKYSQGAAYNFSKYQKISQGSWMFGFNYSNLAIDMDFNLLSNELTPYYPLDTRAFRFHYYSYCVLFGYGFNWVWHPKWVLNVTAMPSIGVNHCYEDSFEASDTLLSLNIQGKMALIYNHRKLFAGLIAKIDGNWYYSDDLSLFNAIEFFALNVGVRF